MTTTTTPPTAWGRLGYVLNWAGIAVGLLFAAIFLRITSLGPPNGTGFTWPDALMAAIIFIVPYAIGRAARYILAGY